MFEKITKVQIIILSLVLGLSLILSTKLIAKNISKNEITVTGSAYELVQSDNAKWRFTIQTRATSKLEAYQKLQRAIPVVKEFLKDNDIAEDEIEELSTNNWEQYKTNASGNMTQEISAYVYSKDICINSKNVELIKKLYLKSPCLVEKGIDIANSQPEYYYSKLADKKLALLEKATLDAKERAQGMLKATNNKVGKIRSVRMGVFQITPADSNDVSNWGINDSSTIEKKITAVANVVFTVK